MSTSATAVVRCRLVTVPSERGADRRQAFGREGERVVPGEADSEKITALLKQYRAQKR